VQHRSALAAGVSVLPLFLPLSVLAPVAGRLTARFGPRLPMATGLLIAALHEAGLAALTHTPSPMGFLNTLLDRPSTERPFLLLVAGYPADGAQVPDITRKPLDEIVTWK